MIYLDSGTTSILTTTAMPSALRSIKTLVGAMLRLTIVVSALIGIVLFTLPLAHTASPLFGADFFLIWSAGCELAQSRWSSCETPFSFGLNHGPNQEIAIYAFSVYPPGVTLFGSLFAPIYAPFSFELFRFLSALCGGFAFALTIYLFANANSIKLYALLSLALLFLSSLAPIYSSLLGQQSLVQLAILVVYCFATIKFGTSILAPLCLGLLMLKPTALSFFIFLNLLEYVSNRDLRSIALSCSVPLVAVIIMVAVNMEWVGAVAQADFGRAVSVIQPNLGGILWKHDQSFWLRMLPICKRLPNPALAKCQMRNRSKVAAKRSFPSKA